MLSFIRDKPGNHGIVAGAYSVIMRAGYIAYGYGVEQFVSGFCSDFFLAVF